jgi:hypothetical protein
LYFIRVPVSLSGPVVDSLQVAVIVIGASWRQAHGLKPDKRCSALCECRCQGQVLQPGTPQLACWPSATPVSKGALHVRSWWPAVDSGRSRPSGLRSETVFVVDTRGSCWCGAPVGPTNPAPPQWPTRSVHCFAARAAQSLADHRHDREKSRAYAGDGGRQIGQDKTTITLDAIPSGVLLTRAGGVVAECRTSSRRPRRHVSYPRHDGSIRRRRGC